MDNVGECHVAVKSSQTSGNGLFTTKDIRPGELVLMVNRPLVGMLDLNRVEDTCSNCFMWSMGSVEGSLTQEKPAVHACAGCKKVKYCSKKCQSQAWKREHKKICLLQKDLPPLPGAVRAARELAVLMESNTVSDEMKQAVRRMESSHTATSSTRDEVDGLVHDKLQNDFDVSYQAAKDIMARDFPDHKQVELELGKIYRNSLTLVTPTYDPLGLAFDPLICTANHSCDPNATIVMDGPLISIRSLEAIPSGSEVFITYIDNTNPFPLRQTELLERFHFTCTCKKCTLGPTKQEDKWLRPATQLPEKWNTAGDDTPLAATAFAKDPRYNVGESLPELQLSALQGIAFNDLESARQLKSPESAIQKTEDVMRLCKQSTMWPLTRQPYASARNELFSNLLLVGKPDLAMYQMVKTYFLIDPVLYPQDFHPVRVVHTWALVKVIMWLYGNRTHPATVAIHASGFDFVVVIWKLLSRLRGLVGKSHGVGRFRVLVEGTADEVRREIGEDNLGLLEHDPQGVWEVFESWKDALEF